VGYGGPMPGGALLVADGFEKTYCGQTFRIDRADTYWWTLSYVSVRETEKILQFTTMPLEPVELLAPNEYCSKNENSMFLNRRLVNLRTKDGSLAIVDDTFCETADHVRTEKKIQSPEELDQLLKSRFGILF
jgi:N-hydroxyarylamine O-acetyltransferase